MPILVTSTSSPYVNLVAVPNPMVEGVANTLTSTLGGVLANLVASNIDFSGSDITSSASLNLVPVAGSISLLPSAGNPIIFGADLQVLLNVISSLNANEDIRLSPNGTGNIILGNQAVPPTLDATANLFNLTSVTAGNLQLAGNTLSSVNLDGDIILAPNGFGQVIVGGIIINNGNISNVNSISTIDLFSINANINVLRVNSSIITPEITAGNLRIVNNSIIAINNNGDIDLHANGQGNVVYHSNLDGNNNNFFNIDDISTNTLHSNDITITSQTVSSPIYRGWIIYNPVTDDTYKALNATIDRNGPGNYTVNWIVGPPTPFYGINVSTALDANGAPNIANITNQNNQSFDIVISTGRDATLYCTMFY